VPRNTCLQPVPLGGSFVTNNTATQWWLFRSYSCNGSHYVVHANVNLDLRNIPEWNDGVRAVMRTALITIAPAQAAYVDHNAGTVIRAALSSCAETREDYAPAR
jgi:hypothetical protein